MQRLKMDRHTGAIECQTDPCSARAATLME